MVDVEQLAARPAWLDVLVQRATRFDGQPPFSDGSLVALATGERVVLAIGDVAAALVAPGEAEFVVDPDARRHGHGGRMLDALLERVPSGLRVWAHGDHPAARALATSRGLLPVRELLQLRAAVPADSSGSSRSLSDRIETPARSTASGLDTAVDGLLDQPVPEPPSVPEPVEGSRARDASTGSATVEGGSATVEGGSATVEGGSATVTVAAASAGFDADEWVALNARSFAAHPEQGAVTRADLDVLRAEPWFDADDLLLLRDDGELVGYCWLKVEHGIGEFYVVGVSPARQGEGLGRLLVRAGLARLSARGIRTASLYVEGDNEPALALYRSFGFVDHTIDVQYAAS